MTHQRCHPEPDMAKGLKPWPCGDWGLVSTTPLDSSSLRSSEWQAIKESCVIVLRLPILTAECVVPSGVLLYGKPDSSDKGPAKRRAPCPRVLSCPVLTDRLPGTPCWRWSGRSRRGSPPYRPRLRTSYSSHLRHCRCPRMRTRGPRPAVLRLPARRSR